MLTAAVIRLLAEKGLSALDIAEIADAMQPARNANAERQQRFRDNCKEAKNNVTRNVTPPNDIYSNPPHINPIEPNGSIAPRGRKPKSNRRLPDDWQPEPLTAETAAMVQLWEVGRLERELSKFKDYWKGASGRRASKDDWQAAWRFWLANADEWNNNGTGSRSTNQSGKSQDGFTSALRQVADGGFDEPFGAHGKRVQ